MIIDVQYRTVGPTPAPILEAMDVYPTACGGAGWSAVRAIEQLLAVARRRGVVDTLLVRGCTTSGCVRSTVSDAFAYNFRAAVVEECVYDRGALAHAVNLFDIHSKYADVIWLAEAIGYLESVTPAAVAAT